MGARQVVVTIWSQKFGHLPFGRVNNKFGSKQFGREHSNVS